MVSFDEAVQKFDRYIWALAHRFAGNMRACDPSDLHQEGLIKLYEVHTAAANRGKSDDELGKLFKKSLVNTLIDMRRKQHTQDVNVVTVDLEVISQMFGEDAFAELQLQYCRDYISHFVSPEAAVLLANLLDPSPAVLHSFKIQQLRRAHIRRQGFNTLVTRKITHQLVGQVLGFSPSRTKALIRELQVACLEHLCLVPSCKLNAAMC